MKRFVALFLMLAFVLSACGSITTAPPAANSAAPAGSATPAASGEVIAEWDMVVQNSLTHAGSVLCADFAALLEERSGGRIKITVRAPGELPYTSSEYLVAIGDGGAHIGDVNAANLGPLRVAALCTLPFLMKNEQEYYDVMDILRDEAAAELSEFNVKMLYHFLWPPQSLWTKEKEIKSFADLEAMKIRTANAELGAFAQAAGMVPVTLIGSEVPTALQTGVVEGVVTAAMGLGGAGWYDSLKYGYSTCISFSPSFMCVNQDEYDKLPDDLKQIIDETSAEFEAIHNQGMMASDQEWKDRLISEYGFVIHDASEEDTLYAQSLMVDYWNDFANGRGGKAPEYLQKVADFLGVTL